MDGNNQIVPVAYASCRGENFENYTIFFQKLQESIGHQERMIFITYRHKGIKAAIEEVCPNAYHGVRGHHLKMNLFNKRKATEQTTMLFWLTCKAYTVPKFNELYRTLKAHNRVAWNLLQKCGPEKWARAHFLGDQYNIMTSNSAESINALTKEARRMPIVIRIYNTTNSMGLYKDRQKETQMLIVDSGTHLKLNISGCGHVIPVLRSLNYDDCSPYANPAFTTETYRSTYEELIHPLPAPVD
ncbi:hypothetical protein LXL04_023699 [Taraxacum kok-saghyz]